MHIFEVFSDFVSKRQKSALEFLLLHLVCKSLETQRELKTTSMSLARFLPADNIQNR